MSDLADRANRWGAKQFVAVYRTCTHTIRCKTGCEDIGEALAQINDWQRYFNSQDDLISPEDRLDPQDVGSVKLCPIGDIVPRCRRVVAKRVRLDRVPSIYHEAYISYLLSIQRIGVPDVIAVMLPTESVELPFMISLELEGSISLSDYIRQQQGMTRSETRIRVTREAVISQVALATRELLSSGILQDELDLRNIRISFENGHIRVFFLDFERTRVVRDEPDEQLILRTYSKSIPRRLERLGITDGDCQTFADAFTAVGPALGYEEIAIRVASIRQGRSSPMRLVVGIDGFAGAGKTTFAQCIAAAFDSPVVILGTDQFMRYSRAERMANAERLHDHRDWYDTARLGLLLAALRKSNAVKVHVADTYDHATGRSDAPLLIEVTDDSAIIVEGMYALEPEIRQHCDFSFLLTAKDDALLGRIYKRDTSERSIDPGAVLERSSIINGPVYQNFFRRHFTDADAVLDTSADSYQASFLRLNYRFLSSFLNL